MVRFLSLTIVVTLFLGCTKPDANRMSKDRATKKSEREFANSPNRVVVTTYHVIEKGVVDYQRRLDSGKITNVADADALKQFGVVFANAGLGKESDFAGGWIPLAEIELRWDDGRAVTVKVTTELDYWSEGQGDWPLPESFAKFFLNLVSKQ